MRADDLPERLEREISLHDSTQLLAVFQELSRLRDLAGVMAVVRRAARALSGADGVTFVLREGEQVYYADEDAIAPLWKGRRFPAEACVSGWAIRHRATVVIEDIYADARVPADAYRPTFVRSLAVVPIRTDDPVGAIGAYWSTPHRATARETSLLEALAGATAVAVANAELYQQALAAERAQADAVRMRDVFLLIAGHELRTPLTALRLQLEGSQRLLAKADAATHLPRVSARIAQANGSVARLAALVEQLLDVSLISEGAVRLEPEPLDLGDVVSDVAGRFVEPAARHGCEVRLSVQRGVRGSWDRLRLESVTTNLLGNALKYGAGRPVEVTVAQRDARALLVVRDFGIGIDPLHQERIFERGARAVSERHYGGLGLGLWLVREIVQASGGSVALESAPGAGAKFEVTLPLASSS